MKPRKTIGILGGAGPAATAKFFDDVVDIAQKKYKAEQDTDFPIVYLYNMPMEGFSEVGFAEPELVKQQLITGVKKVEGWGADFIVLPCNTVHFFVNEMRDVINIPLISIIQVTVDKVKSKQYKKVGILSSASTRELELYKKPLEENNISVLVATNAEQKLLDDVVLAVMSGTQGEKEKQSMLTIVNRMKNEGAETVILGCTELPLAINQSDTNVPIINTIQVLAESAVDESYK